VSIHLVAVWRGSPEAIQFRSPSAVTVDNRGNVYVADTGNNRIVELSPKGHLLRVLGTTGSGPGELRHPSGLAVDRLRNVYVADTGNNRFQIFPPNGTPAEEWTRFHDVSLSSIFGPSQAVTVNPSGRVDVAARSYVGEVDAGSGNEVALYGGSHFTNGDELAGGIAADAHNDVYLTVPDTGMVYEFGEHPAWDPSGPLLAQWGGGPIAQGGSSTRWESL
jgi:streptogramin lyase